MSLVDDPDFKRLKELESLLETFEKNSPDSSNVIAFNYLWPAYGLAFLENSIKAITKRVNKYILFLNEFSYVSDRCSQEDIDYVYNIAKKYPQVEIIFNTSQEHPDGAKKDNIGYYFSEISKIAVERNIEYVWLVQTDEVYDDETIVKVLSKIKARDFEGCAAVFQPLCYIDNPHWVVDPPEKIERPTLIHVSSMKISEYNYNHIQKIKYLDIQFHHLSQVLTRSEMSQKYVNWGHRDHIDNLMKYLDLLDVHKTNKTLQDLHPIVPTLYHSVKFVDAPINKELMLYWIKHLYEKANPYDSIYKIFENTTNENEFPKLPDFHFPLSNAERRLLSIIISECIPRSSTVMEYGSWNGYKMMLMKLINPDIQLYSVDNYGKPDRLFGQYGDPVQMRRVYELAVKKMLEYNLNNTHIFNGTTKFPSLFPNQSVDFLLVDFGVDPQNNYNLLVETRPKLKSGALILGHWIYNTNLKEKITPILSRNSKISCPWGEQIFDYYELYTDILGDLQKVCDIDVGPQFGMYLARVK